MSKLALLFKGGLFSLLLFGSAVSSKAAEQNIHALRSAYLYYFSHFISWPKNAVFPDSKLKLCVRTDDESDRFQLATINNKNLGENILEVVLLDGDSGITLNRCHMLYVAESHASWLESVRSQLDENVLLVTEGSFDEKGVIHLFKKNKKLKFTIDNVALKEHQFRASSKLLRLSARGRTQ